MNSHLYTAPSSLDDCLTTIWSAHPGSRQLLDPHDGISMLALRSRQVLSRWMCALGHEARDLAAEETAMQSPCL